MNNSIAISIIVPCYNAVGYIDRAVSSLINQSLDNGLYEIILVNDASTDNTLEKLQEWEAKYPDNIMVITYDKNLRQGGARNVGIQYARGEYVGFLDADDWMDKNALSHFYKIIAEDKYDIVSGSFVERSEYNEEEYCEKKDINKRVLAIEENSAEDIRTVVRASLGYVWNAIYKRSMITDNDIWFPEHLAYEDIYWINLVKLYAETICFIDSIIVYYFCNNSESTTKKKNASHHIDRLVCYEMLLEKYKEMGLMEKIYQDILNQTIEIYVINSYFMFFSRMEYIPDVYSRIRKTINDYFPDWSKVYNIDALPIPYNYLMRYFEKAEVAREEDLEVFKDTVLEVTDFSV